MTKDQLKDLITGLQDDDLRTLRAIINGKLGKRTISPEAQAKMQESRKARKEIEGYATAQPIELTK